jgi:RNA polymerase sigma factor (sigma-70 family)
MNIPWNFDETYSKHYNDTCCIAESLINDGEAARDLVSEVFAILWNKKEKFENLRAVKIFLFVSTRNACLNHIRRLKMSEKHHTVIARRLSDEELNMDIAHRVFENEALKTVNIAIAKMAPQAKSVIQLTIMGLKTDEIAAKMGLAPQTVRNTRNRGVRYLRKRLCQTRA